MIDCEQSTAKSIDFESHSTAPEIWLILRVGCDLTGCFLCGENLFIQSNSNIVESNIVENSNIVDDLAATKDFYLIKIQNSRNPK